MIRNLLGLWDRFWFVPTRASTLGVCRALFFAALFGFYVFEDFSGWSDVSQSFWRPVWLFRALDLTVLPHAALETVQIVWKAALALAAIGLFTRAATIVAFVLGAYLLGLPHSFGQTYHFDALHVFVLAALAVAPSGDAWSLDSLIRVARRPNAPRPATSGVYGWPIRFVWVAMSLVFVAAGLSKLRHSGLEWIASDTMSIFLVRAHYHVSDADPIGRLGLAIAQSPFASRAIALLTILVETAYPLALVSRRARLLLVPSAALMLVGIRVLMGPTFGVFLVCNLFWVPWSRVGAFVRARARGLPRRTLLYDSASAASLKPVAIVRRLDLLQRVDTVDCAYDWSAIASRHPLLNRPACAARIHVVDPQGRIVTGFEAVRKLAAVLPLGWVFLPLMMLPGANWMGNRIVGSMRVRGAESAPRTA
jgi:hypothetical protein